MRSKPSMASDTATARSERRRGFFARRVPRHSRIGRTIIGLNLLGLFILISGALVLNEVRGGLINTQVDALTTQGEFIANIIEETATFGVPDPVLDADRARKVLLLLFIPRSQRARIFDAQGNLIADSYQVSDAIESRELPPLRGPGGVFRVDPLTDAGEGSRLNVARARAALEEEAQRALRGEPAAGVRPTPDGRRVVSVSLPIQHVRAVTGVLTLEAGDVDAIITRERWSLAPFIVIALLSAVASSILLNIFIAAPVRKLARAADQVRVARARAISLPQISRRNDELGDLSRSLSAMTDAQSERMDAIERFAADVTHEIRNPLTSIRSAVETLDLVTDPAARDRLNRILKQDVSRLDRLITDISNASRLDAELSRDAPKPVRVDRLLADIISLYGASARGSEPPVILAEPERDLWIAGREGPLGQVFRNLIDNARSFTALAGRPQPAVRVRSRREGGEVVTTIEDDGPGIPAENLETVFERFYTSRPRTAPSWGGASGNSGLGLSIVRQIVTAHGGRVWADNRTDETGNVIGARFTVALPATS